MLARQELQLPVELRGEPSRSPEGNGPQSSEGSTEGGTVSALSQVAVGQRTPSVPCCVGLAIGKLTARELASFRARM